MKIYNLLVVTRISHSLEEAQRRLHMINTLPHLVTIRLSGEDLGPSVRESILPELRNYYQKQIDLATEQLTQLGVDLSPIPESSEDNETE